MRGSTDAWWDPAQTDGLSEDWLDRMAAMSGQHRVLETPVGVLCARAQDVEYLLSHPALKVPVVEQYQLLGVSDAILERAGRVILGLDGAEHRRLRRLVNKAFTRRAVDSLTGQMRDFLNARLDDVDGKTDFLTDVVGAYPAQVIGGLLGLPASDLSYLTTIAKLITGAQFSMDVERARDYLAAATECDAYLGDLVKLKRRSPGDDILTRLTQVEVDNQKLTNQEIVSLCASLMNAGIDTTRNQASLGMTLFAAFPEQWNSLRADSDVVGCAVEEVLRFRPVTPLLTRLNTEPVQVGDTEIAEGTYISLGVAVANRDPALTDGDPSTFDVSRSTPRHFTFGHGAHFCIGAALARLELRELLSEMAKRFRGIDVVGPAPRRPAMGVYGVTELTLNLTR